jgi:hypothetical protein
VILTPATLSVAPQMESQNTECPSVRTLNFNAEKTKNWRVRQAINNLPELSLSLWNSTLADSSLVMDPFNETFFDYYTLPSSQVDMVATLSAYIKKVMPRANASIEICGGGWNCSYSINFVGPGYKCDLQAKGRNDNSDILANLGSPFNTNSLIPDGDYNYIAHTSGGEYSATQMADVEAGGAPKMKPPFPKHLGAFRTEPVLWIGFSDVNDHDVPIPHSKDEPGYSSAFTPKIYRCEHYVTNYTVQFNHTLAQQFTNVTKRDFLYRIINTTYVPSVDSNDGTADNVTATPDSNFIYPLDYERYRVTAAYHSLGRLMRQHINGSISWTPAIVSNTEALKTRLIDPTSYLVVPTFIEQVQSFYEDIILSLFSNPQFLAVSWAADPEQRSGVGNTTAANLLYPCTRSRLMNKFVYKARDLWIVYSIAIICATVGVAFGAAAIAQNNHHVRTTRFSSIVAATRAPCVDELPWQVSKWGEIPDAVLGAKLGHGIIVDESTRPVTPGLSPGHEGNSKVYYGFAPEGRLAKSELAAMSKRKTSASVLSFRSWK